MFQETETPLKNFIFYQKKAFSIFREKGAPKKFFIFQEELAKSQKTKICYIFPKKIINKCF